MKSSTNGVDALKCGEVAYVVIKHNAYPSEPETMEMLSHPDLEDIENALQMYPSRVRQFLMDQVVNRKADVWGFMFDMKLIFEHLNVGQEFR